MRLIILLYLLLFPLYLAGIKLTNKTGSDVVLFINHHRVTRNVYCPLEYSTIDYVLRDNSYLDDITIIHLWGWRLNSIIMVQLDECVALSFLNMTIKEIKDAEYILKLKDLKLICINE